MVGVGGFEPPTSPLSGVRSNQLSYTPTPASRPILTLQRACAQRGVRGGPNWLRRAGFAAVVEFPPHVGQAFALGLADAVHILRIQADLAVLVHDLRVE